MQQLSREIIIEHDSLLHFNTKELYLQTSARVVRINRTHPKMKLTIDSFNRLMVDIPNIHVSIVYIRHCLVLYQCVNHSYLHTWCAVFNLQRGTSYKTNDSLPYYHI